MKKIKPLSQKEILKLLNDKNTKVISKTKITCKGKEYSYKFEKQ